jgi:hypothetical protein
MVLLMVRLCTQDLNQLLLLKQTDTADSWVMSDNKRNGFNPKIKSLYANASDAESIQ